MHILWFTWKDRKHPESGGAEVVNEELAKSLVKNGHSVILLVGGFKGGKKEELIDGYKVIRVGNRYTVYLHAAWYYLTNLRGWADLIIEEVNTIPFFTQWYAKEKRVLLIYQLCREIWFYQFFFPLNIIGYLIEPIYLFLLSNNKVLTESQSTKKDLVPYGFNPDNISVFPISIDIEPIQNLTKSNKFTEFALVSLGAMRSMKRTKDQIKAFELAKKDISQLKLKIAGDNSGTYGKKIMYLIEHSPYRQDIEYLGKVSKEKKRELMQKSHVILVTSVKEGWGLIVTEAGVQGTPAIVYNVDGLRDSVINGETGIITEKNNPHALSQSVVTMFRNKSDYEKMRSNTYNHNKKFTLTQSYNSFKSTLQNI